LDDS
jgi:hypothetical protein